ncbi:MAG: leucyl aminopeptidase [Gammaproteobacteria bacterium]
MDFQIHQDNIEKQRTECLVIGVYAKSQLTDSAKKLDKISINYISELLKSGDLTGKIGQTLLLHNVPNSQAKRVLLVGCGNSEGVEARDFIKIINTSLSALLATNAKEATYCLVNLNVKNKDIAWKLRQIIRCCQHNEYEFKELKTQKDTTTEKNSTSKCQKLKLHIENNKDANQAKLIIQQATAINTGIALAKNVANRPGNICTPTHLAEQAQQLGKEYKLKITVLDAVKMKKLGMGAFLSVAKGSQEPAKLITIEYKGSTKATDKPIVLVGKGITFDSGGISIKPSAAMDEMKFDMCGAASVLGTLKAVAELKLPINVVGVIAASENLPSGTASKPGDVVTSMSGQTIEILNTDAEGRLVLCDALTYSAKFKPDVIIDIATLTGAMVIALGPHASGLMANDDQLAEDLLSAGEQSHDRVWRFPIWEEYQEMLDSNFADMANCGNREAGSITAGCFLARFTRDYKWAHLDIAGTAWLGGKQKGATGRPVSLLTQYIINRCKK